MEKPRVAQDIPSEPLWAWLALAVTCFVPWLCGGVFKTIGILYVEWLGMYRDSTVAVSWVTMAAYVCNSVPTPLTGYLADKIPMRYLLFVGGLLGCSGMLLGAFATHLWQLILGFGILHGIAYSICMIPSLSVVNKMFSKRRGLANGIANASSSLGSICLPFIYLGLIQEYSARGVLVILAGMWLNVVVIGAFLNPARVKETQKLAEVATRIQKDILANRSKMAVSGSFTERRESYVFNDPDKFNPQSSETKETVIPNGVQNNACDGSNQECSDAGMSMHNTVFINGLPRQRRSSVTLVKVTTDKNRSYETGNNVINLDTESAGSGVQTDTGPTEPMLKENKCSSKKPQCISTYVSMFRIKRFWIFLLYYIFAQVAFYSNLTFLAAYLEELGLSLSEVATFVSIQGGVELCARVFFGMLLDCHWSLRYLIPITGFTLLGCVEIFISFSSGRHVAYTYVAFISVFGGCNFVVRGPLTLDIVSFPNLGTAMGLLEALAGGVISGSQVPLGAMKDAFGTYAAPLRVINSLYLAAAGLLLFILTADCCRCPHRAESYTLTT